MSLILQTHSMTPFGVCVLHLSAMTCESSKECYHYTIASLVARFMGPTLVHLGPTGPGYLGMLGCHLLYIIYNIECNSGNSVKSVSIAMVILAYCDDIYLHKCNGPVVNVTLTSRHMLVNQYMVNNALSFLSEYNDLYERWITAS